MPRPFVAYLRVYEPLSSLEGAFRSQVEHALRNGGGLTRSQAADRERELWLRTQLSAPARLLPGDNAEGEGALRRLDVITLPVAEAPGRDAVDADESPLVCPLDLRPRAAAGVMGFLANSVGPLVDEALPMPVEVVKARASVALSNLPRRAAHVVSSTWTVPLPWFALVDPGARKVVLKERGDAERSVHWLVSMTDARRRAEEAHAVVTATLGEEGPARILRDTSRWLAHFDVNSVVELDYGGLVQLLEDSELTEDTSAEDVQVALSALETGNAELAAERYAKLREFWSDLASREQHN